MESRLNDLNLLAIHERARFIDDIVIYGDGVRDLVGGEYPWPMPRSSDEAMNKTILERSLEEVEIDVWLLSEVSGSRLDLSLL